jgi:hypothetical protein
MIDTTKTPSPLKALKFFRWGRLHAFEEGDPVDWKSIGLTGQQLYKLIHKGYIEDPTKARKSDSKKYKSRSKRSK